MILRRVIQHFRKQEWTAIAIDFVIVVVGVFVGIQVSNWNAARATDNRSAEFTERLCADLTEEYWVYQYLTAYYDEVLANADRAAAALDGGAPLSDEALLISSYRATQFKVRTRRRATYDELTSTGEIGLIRDRKMRDTAMSLYTTNLFDRITSWGVQSPYREAFRMTIPTSVQRALRKNCGDRLVERGDFTGIVQSLDYPCDTGLDETTIASAAAALRAHNGIVPMMRLRIADLETQVIDLKQNNNDILTGLAAVTEKR
jgi:flagellar biosynthesis protein FliQ